MAIQIFKMFLVIGTGQWNHGKVRLSDYPPTSDDSNFSAKELRQIDIEVDVPEVDMTAVELEALECAIRAERASSQVKVNALLDRISKLKCLTHDSDGVPV